MPDQQLTPTTLGSLMQFVPIIIIFGAMFWMMTSSQRKEKKKKEVLLNSLKKGQKVQTIGGILGTIEEIRETELVVLVDVRNKCTLTIKKESVSSAID